MLWLALWLFVNSFFAQASTGLIAGCVTPEEAELVRLVNEYRVANGLQPVQSSKRLSHTAQWHLYDRIENPSAVGGICNTHSWSSNPPEGISWIGMCYTSDHSQAAQMWAKPNQISAGRYVGNGYELAADTGGTQTAANALLQWQNSPSHNAVILQQGVWASVQFTGMGVAILGPYAVLWFGDGNDPDGGSTACVSEIILQSGFEQ